MGSDGRVALAIFIPQNRACSNPEAAALSRMGWEESTPLKQDRIRSQDKALDLPRAAQWQ
jgi:hypothetical protein